MPVPQPVVDESIPPLGSRNRLPGPLGRAGCNAAVAGPKLNFQPLQTPEGYRPAFVEQRLLNRDFFLAGNCATVTHPGTSVPSKMAWRQFNPDFVPWRFGGRVKLSASQEKPPVSGFFETSRAPLWCLDAEGMTAAS